METAGAIPLWQWPSQAERCPKLEVGTEFRLEKTQEIKKSWWIPWVRDPIPMCGYFPVNLCCSPSFMAARQTPGDYSEVPLIFRCTALCDGGNSRKRFSSQVEKCY